MIYFYCFLVVGFILLIYVYLNNFKNGELFLNTQKTFLFNLSPSLIGLFILLLYFLGNTEKPIDLKEVEYTAIGMKHYKRCLDTNDSTVLSKDLFTGIYKDVDNTYREFEIPKGTFDYFCNLWKKEEHTLLISQGDTICFVEWDRKPKNSLIYTRSDVFTNYFKNSFDLYDLTRVSEKIAIKEGLFHRKRLGLVNESNILEPRQSLVYGISLPDSIDREISNVSSMDINFRPILLIWVNSCNIYDRSNIISHQRSYWSGGKYNEAIFCVCIDNLIDKKIVWSGSFSWALTQELERAVLNESLSPGDILNLNNYTKSLVNAYSKNYWKPRNFEDYTILKTPITEFTVLIATIGLILVNLGFIVRLITKREKERI